MATTHQNYHDWLKFIKTTMLFFGIDLEFGPFPSQNEYLKIQSWSVEWILDEEPDIERMHCQASDHNTKASPHKRSPKMIFYQRGNPGFVRFLLFGGKLSFLARTSQPHLLPFRQVISQPPNPPYPKILLLLDNTKNDSKQVKFSNFPSPQMMRRAGLSTPPIPPSPSTPLPTTHQFLWWQAPVPDRHQRAGNIGILCHRFCSWKRNNTMQILNTFVYNNWRTSPGTGVAAFLFIFALLSSLQQSTCDIQ